VENRKQGSAIVTAQGTTRGIIVFVIGLFFAWGFSTVLLDSLIPKLKALFALSYAEVMLSQFCFFLAYFVFSIPAAILLGRVGYMRAIVIGLVVMALGCLGFVPAASLGTFGGILVALFVMASGITLLQVAANPLVAVLGPESSSSSRLTLAQAFNSLGTAIGPIVGAQLILRPSGGIAPDPASAAPDVQAAFRRAEIRHVEVPFLGIAAVLVTLAVIFWWLRRADGIPGAESVQYHPGVLARLAQRPQLMFGVASIFVYVGAEVTIGSLMTNYLMQPSRLDLAAAAAGRYVGLYWTGAMIGRFVGSWILRVWRPGVVLGLFALGAASLVGLSVGSAGIVSATAIIAVGLFNSIMFPTIFTMAITGLDEDTPQGSGLLCMAIVGGAIIPWLSGFVADYNGLASALLVPLCCYLFIAGYGLWPRPPQQEGATP
jgi:MFS transporter, FHS family, L-fucose permease